MGKSHSQKMENEAKSVVGKNWAGGKLTREKLLGNLGRIADFAASKGFQHINQIGTKFVDQFFDHLHAAGRSESTVTGYATAMRTLAHSIGKDNIVPRGNAPLGGSRAGQRLRPGTPNIEKMLEVRQALYEKTEWLGVACDLRAAFGLRAKESMLTKTTFVDVKGRNLLQIEGTKGGRHRSIVVDNVEKGAAVATLKEHLLATGHRSLIPEAMTLLQAYNFQKNTLHRLGATKENCANSHLWRHAYAQALSAQGVNRAEIARDLGHGRVEVISHYVKR